MVRSAPGRKALAALRASSWRSARSGQHDVAGLQSRLALGEGEQRPAGADLDVVGMRADREHRQRPARRRAQMQWQHGGSPRRRDAGRAGSPPLASGDGAVDRRGRA